jgi:hypothetical protein
MKFYQAKKFLRTHILVKKLEIKGLRIASVNPMQYLYNGYVLFKKLYYVSSSYVVTGNKKIRVQ